MSEASVVLVELGTGFSSVVGVYGCYGDVVLGLEGLCGETSHSA